MPGYARWLPAAYDAMHLVREGDAVNPWWGAWAFVAGGVLTAAVLIAWAYRS